MVAAFHLAGFQVYDVTMQDLLDRKITLDGFRGLIFPGGFSFAGKLIHNILAFISTVDAYNRSHIRVMNIF